MRNVTSKITLSVAALFALSLSVSLFGTTNPVVAQPSEVQSPFINDTETAAELSNLLGDDMHVILNATDIANPNNTLPDSISVNIKEDCMQIPNSQHMYCP